MTSNAAAAALVAALTDADPVTALGEFFAGEHAGSFPEVLALARLSEEPAGELHKDNFAHTLRVVAQCGADADLVTRMAALCHDLGKPSCRRVSGRTVTFHGHEQAGVRLTRRRLADLGFDDEFIDAVTTTVLSAGQVQSYLEDWTDAAVRRVRREAGEHWERAVRLAKADCTTRHDHKRQRLWASIDALVTREAQVAEADRRAAERPVLNGDDLAALGVERGPEMGRLLRWLLEENRAGRLCDRSEAIDAIRARIA